MISTEDYQKLIGRRLSQARLEKGLSQQELADLLNANVMQISRWETGKNILHLYNAVWVAEVLGKTLDELFGVYV